MPQSVNQTELCSIKTTKHSITIPPRQSHLQAAVLFEPDKASSWSSGLEVQETLLTVKTGKSCQVEIYIVNNNDHDIVLRG